MQIVYLGSNSGSKRKRAGTVSQEGGKSCPGCIMSRFHMWVIEVQLLWEILWGTYRMYLRYDLSRDSKAGIFIHFPLSFTCWELSLRVLSPKHWWPFSSREEEMHRFLRGLSVHCPLQLQANSEGTKGVWSWDQEHVYCIELYMFMNFICSNIFFSFLASANWTAKVDQKIPKTFPK